MDTVVTAGVAAVAAILGSLLTFFTNHRDSSTKANSTAVEALSITIEQLRRQIDHLESQLRVLDTRFTSVMKENGNLVAELHRHRKLLAGYGTMASVK